MNFIALKMLIGDRAKYIGIILGLTFASLLISLEDSELRRYTVETAAAQLRLAQEQANATRG